MADTLNKTQMDKAVKDTVVDALNDVLATAGATQIDDYMYAFPVEVDGEATYAKITITATQRKDTKAHPAFNLEDAVAAYANKVSERETKAAERAAAKAAKA